MNIKSYFKNFNLLNTSKFRFEYPYNPLENLMCLQCTFILFIAIFYFYCDTSVLFQWSMHRYQQMFYIVVFCTELVQFFLSFLRGIHNSRALLRVLFLFEVFMRCSLVLILSNWCTCITISRFKWSSSCGKQKIYYVSYITSLLQMLLKYCFLVNYKNTLW